MTAQVHRTLVIPAAQRDAALSMIIAIAGEAQGGMLQTPVGDGATVTHYLSTGLIDAEFAAILPDNPTAIVSLATAGGRLTTLEEVNAVLAEANITTTSWQLALADMGLQLMPVNN